MVHIEDVNGNISEEKVGTIRVINPLMVLDQDNQPIENAKVVFSIYNPNLNLYELVPSSSSGIQNPGYTDVDGKLRVVLPKGRYQVEVSEVGYINQKIDFTLGLGENERMPTIVLTKGKTSLLSIVGYYRNIFVDFSNFSNQYLNNLTTSGRFFKLVNVSVFITALVTVWYFVVNTLKIFWWMLPLKIWSFFGRKQNAINGSIVDKETKLPISQALVYLIDSSKS
jgi:hypothetical protein